MPEKESTNADIAKSFTLKKLPDSEVELAGDIPAEALLPYREHALKHVAEHIDLPGFRPGKVPPEMALKKVGEITVLEDQLEHFMQEFYPVLIETHKVDAVGRPDIRITKLAPGNPVGVVIHAAVYPTITLPKNWKTLGEGIAAEPAAPATDEEVDQTIESLRQNKGASAPENAEGAPAALPEVNDEFAKSLGAFENVEALKTQLKKGIGEEKERAAKDTRRGKIIDALLEKTEMEVPNIFIESELEKILAQLREDIGRFHIQFEDYLKRVGKTEDALKADFREQAKKRAKLQLVLNKIAEDEKVVAEKEAIEHEIKHALEHFPDAKPELLRIHVETVLRNEKVLRMLEGEEK